MIQYFFFPALLVGYLAWFSLRYTRGQLPRAGTYEWIFMRDKPSFSLQNARKGKMSWNDALFMMIITLVYAVITFVNLGDTTAPQSFHQFTHDERSVVIELDEPVTIDTVFYYTGLYHAWNDHGYRLSFSPDGFDWTAQERTIDGQTRTTMTQQYSETFRWLSAWLPNGPQAGVKFIKIEAEAAPLELGEIAFVEVRENGDRAVLTMSRMTMTPHAPGLFDEPGTIPPRYDILNSSHFDEIYHARTAYEHLRGIYPYETTHPPLGKLITAVGIKMFGMTPFGWRFMPALFGVLMLPILYLLIQWMFGKTLVSICGTLIFAFDFMHFVQTRISTIDVYAVFFILLMYLFMFRYITSGYDAPFRKTLPWLALCGLSFGLGAAAKWVCIYAGFGLLLMYLIYLAIRRNYARDEGKKFLPFLSLTLGASVVFFLAIPIAGYVACYIPYAVPENPSLAAIPPVSDFGGWLGSLKNLWDASFSKFWDNQFDMLNYHGTGVLGATHAYSSWWYQWLFDLKPILYYINGSGGMRATVSAFTNPLTTWAGLLALGACGAGVWKRRSVAGMFIIVGYLSQLLPWIPVRRITFAYHYFPSMIFITLALCYVFHRVLEREPKARGRVIGFTCAVLLMFALFYPVLSGTLVPEWYPINFLRWLPTWTAV